MRVPVLLLINIQGFFVILKFSGKNKEWIIDEIWT